MKSTNFLRFIALLLLTFLISCSSDDDAAAVSQPLTWQSISQGNNHTVAIRSDGTLWAWGLKPAARIGIGPVEYDTTPKLVGSGTNWEAVASGQNHTIVLKSNGTLWAFGANDFGQLGTVNELFYSANLVQIGSDSDWQLIAAGNDHMIATKSNGSVYTWGSYNYPAWAEGLMVYENPILVTAVAGFQKISSGGVHNLALKADGSLYSWGRNVFGELGLNTNSEENQTTPIPVGTASWESISAGRYHSLGLKSDGTLWAWGGNVFGQLGIGSDYAHFYSPMQIGSENSWKTVASGIVYGLAIKQDGTLWSWGSNYFGQLGHGNTENSNAPLQIGNENQWVSVFPGFKHSYALKTDGSLWGWGNNDFGQLGNANQTEIHTPVLINCPQ